MLVQAPISVGELLDKVSILRIKIFFAPQLTNVKTELYQLTLIYESLKMDLTEQIEELYNINYKIWQTEDQIRQKERDKEFDEKFVELARSVYINNDLRAFIKHKINQTTSSSIVEEKVYVNYNE